MISRMHVDMNYSISTNVFSTCNFPMENTGAAAPQADEQNIFIQIIMMSLIIQMKVQLYCILGF